MWRRGPCGRSWMTGTHLDGRANPGASRREGLWLFNKSLRRVEPACHRESVCAAECQLLRPERRSTDGQMILKVTPDRSEVPPDLLLCGAPLRNRTVDLLLTIHTSLGSLPGKHFPQAAGERRSGSCPGLRRLRSLRPSRLQPSSSWHGSMPSVCSVRPRLVCHSSLASGAVCRPATSPPTVKGRSDDLSYPGRPEPRRPR